MPGANAEVGGGRAVGEGVFDPQSFNLVTAVQKHPSNGFIPPSFIVFILLFCVRLFTFLTCVLSSFFSLHSQEIVSFFSND